MAFNITDIHWTATNLPANLTINESTGVISGTPTVDPGEYTATLQVSTCYGDSPTETIKIVVAIPESWKPVITPNQVVNVTADTAMTNYEVQGTNVR